MIKTHAAIRISAARVAMAMSLAMLLLIPIAAVNPMSASLIGRLGSSTFRLPTAAVSMSLAGSRFSSESAPGRFHHGIRGRGGTIFWTALPSD